CLPSCHAEVATAVVRGIETTNRPGRASERHSEGVFEPLQRGNGRPAGPDTYRGLPTLLPSPYSLFMPGRILIVDDDPDACELLRTFFTIEGYTVDACLDGASALETFRAD